jgi:hypothetical protein
MRKQPPLALDATAVSRQGSIGTNDAMTRDDDADRVSPVRKPHRANGFWATQRCSQCAITQGLPDWNFPQRGPDAALKLSTACFHKDAVDG